MKLDFCISHFVILKINVGPPSVSSHMLQQILDLPFLSFSRKEYFIEIRRRVFRNKNCSFDRVQLKVLSIQVV